MKQEILNYLKEEPRFRERKLKNTGIANLIMKKYGVEIPRDKRDDFISDILGADRYWRKSLEDYPELRGTDYDTKREMEERAQIALEYQPMHHEISNKLNNL